MKTFIFKIISFLALITFPAINSVGAIIYVDTDAVGSDNGNSWNNAYTDLQDALFNAVAGDEIWVAEGIYKPTITTNVDISFEMKTDVDVYGGFEGNEFFKFQRNWKDHLTVLSGAIGVIGDITDNSERVVGFANVDNVVLDGFQIRRAYSSNSFLNFFFSTNINVRHCEIKLNVSTGVYAIYLNNSSVTISDCLIHSNVGQDFFGNYGGSEVEITNSTFSSNEVNKMFQDGSSGITLKNLISYGNDYNQIPFNVFSATNCILEDGESGIQSATNISSEDPLFVEPTADDYSLQLFSPAINTGIGGSGILSFDLNNETRVQAGIIDLGCYEFSFDNTLFVDQDATGANNGLGWLNAFTDLQDALAVIPENGTIFVAEGTYFPTATTDPTITMDIPNGVALYGGYSGEEINPAQRNTADHPTIISGNIGDPNATNDNSNVLLEIIDNPDETIIDGFIIEKSFTDLSTFTTQRGAIIADNSTLTVKNAIIRDNIHYAGTGINTFNATLIVSNTLIHDNISSAGGFISGSVGTEASDMTLYNVTVTDNALLSTNNILTVLSGSTLYAYNSIFWNGDINALGSNTGYIEAHNCIVQAGDLNIDVFSNISTGDPLFEDPSEDIYYLSTGSNALDSGDNFFVTDLYDLFGNDRIQNGTVDLGALEGLNPFITCDGDADRNGVVNILDLVAVSSNFGCESNCILGDADFNGIVNILDLIVVSSNFGVVCQ